LTIETSDLSKEVKLLFLFKNAYINNFYKKKKDIYMSSYT